MFLLRYCNVDNMLLTNQLYYTLACEICGNSIRKTIMLKENINSMHFSLTKSTTYWSKILCYPNAEQK